MKIAVSSNGADLSAESSPIFGRCPVYIFVDSETMAFEAFENPAIGTASGAGIQAAQLIVERGAEALITGNVGPNAYQVLSAAGVEVYLSSGGTVQQAVEALKAGTLPSAGGPSAAAHSGIGGGVGRGMGMGRGMGRGMGMRQSMAAPVASSAPATPVAPGTELDELKDTAASLRRQLADLMDRLDQLEKGA